MHGIVLFQLKLFVTENFGSNVWQEIQKKSGQSGVSYFPSKIYEDELVFNLVGSACEVLSISQSDALRAFGQFIAKPLTEIYKSLIKKEWTVIDLIANVEDVIHRVVRLKMEGATPPELITSKISEEELKIIYTSNRQMCDLLKGICIGLGDLYDQYLEPIDEKCMQDGDERCEVTVTIVEKQITDTTIELSKTQEEPTVEPVKPRWQFWKR